MLKLENISKTFHPGTASEKRALENMDLHLVPGDFLTILGSNGAGKSTLFNVIAGTFPPDSGTITLAGRDITREPEYKRSRDIGRLFQDPLRGTAPNMTIGENLALAYLRGSPRRSPFSMVTAADRRLFRDRLARLELGLEDRMDTNVGLLSGGQRQALALLMATLVTPKLLLLDEHTAALDPATAEKVLDLTRRTVAEDRITCLMVTHSIPAALALGNRTILMGRGRILLHLDETQKREMTPGRLLDLFRDQDAVSDRMAFEE